MERRLFLKLSSGSALAGLLGACHNADHPPTYPPPPPPPAPATDTMHDWTDVIVRAARESRVPAPVASRAIAIVYTAMYDAWAAYDPVALGTRLGAQLRRPATEHSAANKARAISYAAYAALSDQFPAQKALFDAQMDAFHYLPGDASPSYTEAQGVGTLAAKAVLEMRHGDGANQLGELTVSAAPYADYTGYVPLNPPLVVAEATPRSAIPAPDRWQPLTFVDSAGAVRTPPNQLPFWGQVTPFALRSGDQYRPPAPARLGSAEFIAQAEQLVATQIGLTEQQKVVVDYWGGGTAGETPPGLWVRFAQFVARRDRYDEDMMVKLFFAVGNATMDALIATWDAKRAYDSARPISAIRYLFNGRTIVGYGLSGSLGVPGPIQGETWTPYQLPSAPTPPFADHVSGHSTLSAASAEVLRLFTGSDRFGQSVTIGARSMLLDPALPAGAVTLRWETFSEAALEASQSRVLSGIHFERASADGRVLGAKVGAAVFARAQQYWLGKTCPATCP